MRIYCVLLITSVAVALAIGSPPANAQPVPVGPIKISPPQPVVPVPPGLSAAEEESYRKTYADYQRCLRDRDRDMQLARAAENLLAMPRQRAFFEGELARKPEMRKQFPGGFRDIVDQQFREYRRLGGTASSPETVLPIAPPCSPPTLSRDLSRSPVTSKAVKPVAPR